VVGRELARGTLYDHAGPVLVSRRDVEANTRTWYHADRLGPIRLLTSDQGTRTLDRAAGTLYRL
jgi:hypothetical protein